MDELIWCRAKEEAVMSNQTQVIVFASQKGGSGKTTISGHMAVQAELSGAGPVALIDTDPQGSLAKWWNSRESDTPAFAQVSITNLSDDIKFLRKAGFRYVMIDTPPAITSSISEIVSHADLVVVPTRPSPHDLRAVGPTVDIIEHYAKPLLFVVNSATARAKITSETAVALSQHGTVAPVNVHHRVDFAASMIDGRTVMEASANGRSAKEIAQLWAYIEERMRRLQRKPGDVVDTPLKTFENDILTPLRKEQLVLVEEDEDEVEAFVEAQVEEPKASPPPQPKKAEVAPRKAPPPSPQKAPAVEPEMVIPARTVEIEPTAETRPEPDVIAARRDLEAEVAMMTRKRHSEEEELELVDMSEIDVPPEPLKRFEIGKPGRFFSGFGRRSGSR